MALDRACTEPQFPDFGDILFLPFIVSLLGRNDAASALVKDLYLHEYMLVAYEQEGDLLPGYDQVVNDIQRKIGPSAWKVLNTLYDRNLDEYWEALHAAIDAPKVRSRSLGDIALI